MAALPQPDPGFILMVALTSSGLPRATPALVVCRVVISAKSPGGLSFDLSCQPGLSEVPGSPLVTWMWRGAAQEFNNERHH